MSKLIWISTINRDGDRWVENFVLRMQEKCSALQKMPKNGRNLQRAANF